MRQLDPLAKKGMRIRMIHMDDERPVDEGMEGTIRNVDDMGTIHVTWDDGRTLGVVPNVDEYELLPSEEDQIDFDVFEDSAESLIKKISKKPMSSSIDKTFKKAYTKNDLKVESDEIEGGVADGMTIKDIAKKHNVPIGDIKKELKIGTKIELEHTDSRKKAKEIAMDHLAEFPDYYSNEEHGLVASEKKLEKDKDVDLEETTTAGAAGAYNAPLFGKPTTIKKPKTKKTSSKIITKGDLKNPLGKIYSFKPKTESKVFKVGDLLSEISSTHASKLRAAEGTYDGDPWVGKKGWMRKDELAWEGGKIADILAKLDINWNDTNLSLTDKETDAINEVSIFKRKKKIKSFQDYNDYINGIDTTITVYEKGDKFLVTRRGDYEEYVIRTFSKDNYSVEEVLDIVSDMSNEDKFRTEPEHFTHIDEGLFSRKKEIKSFQDYNDYINGIDTTITVYQKGNKFLVTRRGDEEYVIKTFDNVEDALRFASDMSNEEKFRTEPEHFTSTLDESKKKKESPIHKKKWERCVKDVEKKNKENKTDYNPYAVCTASIGYEGSIKKPHRRKDKEDIEETTTFSSVFGSGYPVTPFMFAKKGKHIPSKKPIWKGGKIVQKTTKADLLDEINKVKWVKGGKYVKIKDRCAKYNNKPWCSQGAIDNPLELSDTTFENIKKVSKKMNISEGDILDKIKAKLKGVSKKQMEYNKEHGLPIWWQGSKEGFYEYMEPRKNYTGSN